jgi:hypothetical protein
MKTITNKRGYIHREDERRISSEILTTDIIIIKRSFSPSFGNTNVELKK